MPPVAATVVLYGVPTVPFGRLPVEMASGGAVTVMLSDLVAVAPLASVTVTEALKVPVAVGVPLMVPVEAPIANPPGRPLADQEYGATPPETATVVL